MRLTVIMRDDSPMIFYQEPVRHRTVHIALTPGQQRQLEPRITGTNGGREIREEIAMCFLEEEGEKR